MNLLKTIILIGVITSISRVLGFIRDIIIAMIFGASEVTDSFFTSFKLVNFLKRIFIENSFINVFVPILIKYKKKNNIKKTKNFISNILGILMIFLIFITIFGILFSSFILKIFIPGFTSTNTKFNLTNKILKIIFPYIIISTLSLLTGIILNIWGNFIVPSLSLSIINIFMIIFSIFSKYIFDIPILSLAWALLLGNIFQLIYQLKYISNINMIVIPKISFKNSDLKNLMINLWPAILSSFVNQISTISNNIFASFLSSGSISWMYYADKIIELPSSIITSTLNTILFPYLSNSVINNDKNNYSKFLDCGLRLSFIISLPIMMILIILSKNIVFTFFNYGKFSYIDSLMTSYSLIAYSIGLIGIILVKVLTPSFYSYQDTKTPLKISFITFIFTQLLNILLIKKLKYIGLSLSVGISSCFNSILLYYFLIKKKLFYPRHKWKKFLYKIFLSTINMSIILIILNKFILLKSNIYYKIFRLFLLIIISIIIYIISLFFLKINKNDIIDNFI